MEAVEQARRHARVILDGEPWSAPADRDPRALARPLREAARQRQGELQAAADAAENAVRFAQARVGMLDRLLRTAPWREAQAAMAAVQGARLAAECFDLGAAYQDADRQAECVAAAREQQRTEWERRPYVQQARDQDRLTAMVLAGLEDGDERLARAVLRHGVATVIEAVRRADAADQEPGIPTEPKRTPSVATSRRARSP